MTIQSAASASHYKSEYLQLSVAGSGLRERSSVGENAAPSLVRSGAMKHWTPHGRVLKYAVLTIIALIAKRLFYVQS